MAYNRGPPPLGDPSSPPMVGLVPPPPPPPPPSSEDSFSVASGVSTQQQANAGKNIGHSPYHLPTMVASSGGSGLKLTGLATQVGNAHNVGSTNLYGGIGGHTTTTNLAMTLQQQQQQHHQQTLTPAGNSMNSGWQGGGGGIRDAASTASSGTAASSAAALAARTSIRVVKNDYNQHFVDTGERPQNFVRDHEPAVRFSEYPKMGRLIKLKDDLIKWRAHPPVHIRADFKAFDLMSLNTQFDVILIDPPWKEYSDRTAVLGKVVSEDLTPMSVDEILKYLPVDQISATPSFCFMWAGSTHLEDARLLLQKWGFRRCEDICWCKTNHNSSNGGASTSLATPGVTQPTTGNTLSKFGGYTDDNSVLVRSKEHCLLGVKGLVRRSTDTHFIHSNVDTDIIIDGEPKDASGRTTGSTAKPKELYDIIERFCLGRRRLELFGVDRNIRPGWLTIGKDISLTNFDAQKYATWMSGTPPALPVGGIGNKQHPSRVNQAEEQQAVEGYVGGRYLGTTPEIDALRPKSPPRGSRPASSNVSMISQSG